MKDAHSFQADLPSVASTDPDPLSKRYAGRASLPRNGPLDSYSSVSHSNELELGQEAAGDPGLYNAHYTQAAELSRKMKNRHKLPGKTKGRKGIG